MKQWTIVGASITLFVLSAFLFILSDMSYHEHLLELERIQASLLMAGGRVYSGGIHMQDAIIYGTAASVSLAAGIVLPIVYHKRQKSSTNGRV